MAENMLFLKETGNIRVM